MDWVAGLLLNHRCRMYPPRGRSCMPKLALIGCGLVMLGILSDAGGRTALAQSIPEAPKAISQDRPSFEVASVRPAPKDPGMLRDDPLLPKALSNGRFDAEARLRVLINWAFKPQVPFE